MTAPGTDLLSEGSHTGEPSVSRLEVALAVVWVLAGVAIILLALQIRVPAIADPIGPRTLPILIGFGLIGLGLVLLVRALGGRVESSELSAGDEEDEIEEPPEARRVLTSIGVIVGYLLIMPVIGFIGSTVLAGALLMWVQGARGLIVGALPAGIAIVVFLTFSTLLNVRFP